RHPKVGETVLGNGMFFFPGGKGANQAVAAARLGAPTTLIGRTGRDAFGGDLRAFLTGQGVDLRFVEGSDLPTGTALIVVAEKDNAIVVVAAANGQVSRADVERATFARDDVLVAQLEIPVSTVAAFFARGRA